AQCGPYVPRVARGRCARGGDSRRHALLAGPDGARYERRRTHQHHAARRARGKVARACQARVGGPERAAPRMTAWLDPVRAAVDPIFTPPWNRCTAVTAACLAALGFEMLSRDADAETFGFDGIRELSIHLDWTGRRGVAAGPDAWGDAIAARLRAASAPVGLMLHHAVMTREDRTLLDELLRLLTGHGAVKFSSMAALGSCTSARGVV